MTFQKIKQIVKSVPLAVRDAYILMGLILNLIINSSCIKHFVTYVSRILFIKVMDLNSNWIEQFKSACFVIRVSKDAIINEKGLILLDV